MKWLKESINSNKTIKGEGYIILDAKRKIMSSIIGTLGLPDLVGYGASKGAIISLTKSLALEWAEYGVRVNVLVPGFCETSYADNFKKNKVLYDFTLERIPLKKWGKSNDISNACLYLSSEMSSYVTGEIITIDGGWSAW